MRRNSQSGKMLFIAAMLWLCMTYAGFGQTTDKAQVKQFEIPSLSLLQALTQFSVQSNIQFVSSNPRISILISRPVSGTYTPWQALEILLEGSGFGFEFTQANMVRVFRVISNTPDESREIRLETIENPEISTDIMAMDMMDQGEDDPAIFEEIIVMARKRAENVLNIPIAVTVLGRRNLDQRGISNISAISDIIPNVNFSSGGTSSGSGSAAVVYIRGVGQNDFTPVTDPGVGIYVDGIYLGRTIGSVLEIIDLERIEVLRGPQGTLFGRNTIGGAISLITRDPGDEFQGRIKFTLGQDELYGLSTNFDLPITEKLSAVISGLFRKRDGYVTRPLVGDRLGDENIFGGRLKLVFRPTEDLTLKFSMEATREREKSAPEVSTDIKEDAPFVKFYNAQVAGGQCAGGGALDNSLCANDQYVGQPFISYETGPSQNRIDAFALSLIAEQRFSDRFTLKSLTSYRTMDAQFSRSSDGTPFTIFQTTNDFQQNQFTQEVQLIGMSFGERLDWVAGGFYMVENAIDQDFIESILPTFPRVIGGEVKNENYAIFSETTYNITDRFHITGGLRFTHEKKNFLPIARILADALPYVPPIRKEISFSEVTWRSSLTYQLSQHMTSYVTLSKGFKSGGFVQRLTRPVLEVPTFRPEYVKLYEAGLKMEFPEHWLRLNLAAFYSAYDDIQVAANPLDQINTVTANAARGSIRGFEAEFTWRPLHKLLLEGSLGYQDARYDEVGNIGVSINRNDDFIRTPKYSLSLGVTYQIDMGERGTLAPRLDWVYKSAIQFEPDNDSTVAEDGYHAVNFRLTYSNSDERVKISAAVENLTNTKYLVAGDSNDVIGYSQVMYARPRNWTLNVAFSF